MVAYATEVDRRRKSTDSSNSRLSHDEAKEVDDVFEAAKSGVAAANNNFRLKNMGQVRGVVSADSPYARTMPAHKSSKSHVPSALASIGSLEDLPKSPPRLPGENLPEHHFKKRYFATSHEQQSKSLSPS